MRSLEMRTLSFARRLLTWGAALDTWSVREREAAKHLLASNPKARQYYREACQLEASLQEARLPEPATDFVPRILAAARNTPQSRPASEALDLKQKEELVPRYLTLGGCARIAASLLLLGFVGGYLTGGSTESALTPWQLWIANEWSWI
jgi:hypothetical protein